MPYTARHTWEDAVEKSAAMVRTLDGMTCHACPTVDLAYAKLRDCQAAGIRAEILLPNETKPRYSPTSEVLARL